MDQNMDVDALHIVNYPEPVLRRRAEEVDPDDPHVAEVAQRMVRLMLEAPGVGLAAPRVGLSWRMFVASPSGRVEDHRVYLNPVLCDPSRELEDMEEGCLSLPDIRAPIRRPRRITLSARTLDGERIAETRDDFLARIWQHECDHLDGVLILDRMANRRLIKELEAAG